MLFYTYPSQRLPKARLFSIAKNLVLKYSLMNWLCVDMLLSFHPRSTYPLSIHDIHVIKYSRPSMPFVLQMTKAVQRPGNEATESESWWYLEWLNIHDVIVMYSPSSRLVPSLVPRPAESGPGIRAFSLLPHACVISGNQALFGGGRSLGTRLAPYSGENTVQLISPLFLHNSIAECRSWRPPTSTRSEWTPEDHWLREKLRRTEPCLSTHWTICLMYD